ncbi:solute:sodium symporter family transporter [Candidatus Epulonipiscium fishelsonii]|uniref:Solute:sodium symporter family transporter n=1 Tax=Candidatus Epulonipiscium fishelsonii TaxID=77094 RepID=A0ACC8XFJ5_9FIRM|nr:solute:sodium symporter family transporter [Epulopiscium sp. SCG-B05WGA-EpuloA1]ONI41948.1 solute:sodium symporter family transporter [Epulopiscium sp. SCG-B11WGA-EpuloA1]
MDLTLIFTLGTFIFFTGLVGYVSAKIVKKTDDQKTSAGYFLAGNGLTGIFIAGSMMLTNLSAESLVGLTGQSYVGNMTGMAWESTAVIATIIMALIFLPLYLKKGYTTLPQFMEERYGSTVRRLVSLFFLVGYLLIGIPVTLYAGAIAFNQIFDLQSLLGVDTSTGMTILIVLLGIVGAIYAVLGGLKAVAISDSINGILMIVSAVLLLWFGFNTLGEQSGGGFIAGVADVLNNNPEKLNAIGGPNDVVPFFAIFTGMFLANMFYWGTNQVLIQRTLGAKNLKEGQKGVLLSGLCKMIVPLISVIPGLIAYRLIPGLENGDYAYPALVATVLPWPLIGLYCAAFFGAIVSTYNSFLNSASTIFMLDIYKPMFNPNIEDAKLVTYSKRVGWLFAAFAILFTPNLQFMASGLFDFGRSFTGYYNMPIITFVLLGMFTKIGSPMGACLATVWHLVFYSGYKYWFKMIDLPLTNAILEINYMHIYAISFIVMVIIMYLAGKKWPNEKEFNMESTRTDDYDMTPWEHRKPVVLFLVSFLVYLYFLFSPLGLATAQRNDTLILIVSLVLVVETIGIYIYCKKSSNKTNEEK